MTPIEIVLIVIASVFGYGFMAGVTWRAYPDDARWDRRNRLPELWPGPILAAVWWPVTLPMLMGIRAIAAVERRALKPPQARALGRGKDE